MASNSFKLEIVTADRKLFSGDAEIVIVRTTQGYEGFMARHAWACKLLGTGELLVKDAATGEHRVAAASGGFIDVKDSITVFAEAAEWQEDIDGERAAQAKALAEKWLEDNKDSEDEFQIEDNKSAQLRAANRLKIKEGGVLSKK